MKYIAFTTKGLEKIAAEEIKLKIPDAKISETGDKRIVFEADINSQIIGSLRTVDDLGILINETETKSLNGLLVAISLQKLNEAKTKVAQIRELNNTFSLTVGAVGTKGFIAKNIIAKLKTEIIAEYGWEFTEFNHRNVDIRIFIDHVKAYVAVRLTRDSLQHRSYKTDFKPGSLKSTIAAAMILMATNSKNHLKIVDNFCGSGTILCEAYLENNEVFGGDIDRESVSITEQNLKNSGYTNELNIKQLNATKTNWPDKYFDCAISNLPWDKQIKTESITDLYLGTVREYQRIVKPEGKICLLVSKPELLAKLVKKVISGCYVEEIKIGLLGQNPSIIYFNI